MIADQGMFRNINNVSVTTIDRILRGNHMSMVQLYTVTFQRNYDVVKEARCQYVEVGKHYYSILPCHIMHLESSGVTFHCQYAFFYLEDNGA